MRVLFAAAMILCCSGCLDLFEGLWFNPDALDEYDPWPLDEVGAENRELVTLAGAALDDDEAPELWGVWAHQCRGDAPLCFPGQPGCDCVSLDTPEFDPERQDDVILYFHGNGGHLLSYWDRVQILWRRGHPVFMVDYRGYGRSSGEPTEAGIYADARTARDHVVGRIADARGLTGTDGALPPGLLAGVSYWGFSLGSTAAIDLAVSDPPRVLVTEAALAGAQAFVDDAAGIGVSSSVLMDTRFDNISKMPAVVSPKLIMHGTDDDFVRFEFSQLLFDSASEPRQLYAVLGADHGNVPCPARDPDAPSTEEPCIGEQRFHDVLDEFLGEHLP